VVFHSVCDTLMTRIEESLHDPSGQLYAMSQLTLVTRVA